MLNPTRPMPISSYWNMGNKIKIVSTMLDGNKQTHEIREYEQVKLFCKGDWYCYPHWELQLWFWNWTRILLHIWHTGSLYFTEHTWSESQHSNPNYPIILLSNISSQVCDFQQIQYKHNICKGKGLTNLTVCNKNCKALPSFQNIRHIIPQSPRVLISLKV